MLLGNVLLFVSVSILLILTFYQCFQTFTIYFKEPTYFSSSFTDQKFARLPDITACFVSNVPNTPAFRPEANVSHQNWKNDVIEQDLDFDNITYGNDWDIVNYFYIRRFETQFEDKSDHSGSTGFRISADHDERLKDENLLLRSHPRYGKCVTLSYSEENRPLGLYYFVAKG